MTMAQQQKSPHGAPRTGGLGQAGLLSLHPDLVHSHLEICLCQRTLKQQSLLAMQTHPYHLSSWDHRVYAPVVLLGTVKEGAVFQRSQHRIRALGVGPGLLLASQEELADPRTLFEQVQKDF